MSYSREYKSVFTAENRTQETVDQVVEGIERISSTTITIGQKAEEAAGMSMRAFSRLLFTFQMGVFYVGMLSSAMYQNESAAIAVENAQDSYNSAVKDYGVNSEQAIRAERTLIRTRKMVETANLRASLSWVGMGLQIVNVSAVLLRSAGVTKLGTVATNLNTIATKLNIGAKLTSVGASAKYAISTIVAKTSDLLHVEVLKQKVSLMSALKYGLFAAAGAIATYAVLTASFASATHQANEELERQKEIVGEGPQSTGLVKGFHDLSAAVKAVPNISIGGTTIYASGEEDLEVALERYKRKVLREFRSAR